jgi:hypothetical protein
MPSCHCTELAIQNKTFRGQHFTILEEIEKHSCVTHLVIECNKCKQIWRVEEDFSYHHPLLYWQHSL